MVGLWGASTSQPLLRQPFIPLQPIRHVLTTRSKPPNQSNKASEKLPKPRSYIACLPPPFPSSSRRDKRIRAPSLPLQEKPIKQLLLVIVNQQCYSLRPWGAMIISFLCLITTGGWQINVALAERWVEPSHLLPLHHTHSIAWHDQSVK